MGLVSLDFFQEPAIFFRRLVRPNVNMGPYGKRGVSHVGGGHCIRLFLFVKVKYVYDVYIYFYTYIIRLGLCGIYFAAESK